MHLFAFIGYEIPGLIFDLRSVKVLPCCFRSRNTLISEDLAATKSHDYGSFSCPTPHKRNIGLSYVLAFVWAIYCKTQKSSILRVEGFSGIHSLKLT